MQSMRTVTPTAVRAALLSAAMLALPAGAAEPGTVTLYDKPEPFTFDAETQARQKLVLVALEKAPADLVIKGARVLNVHTLKWMENHDIVIAEAWVSRKHAQIAIRHQQLEYSDHSSSGSVVQLSDGKQITVHRRATLLSGTGIIYAGTRAGPDSPCAISFTTHNLAVR